MPDPTCSSCGHAMSMSRCWRLTCPSNGAGISSQLVYDRAVAQCASAARMVMRSSLFDPEPPEKAYVGMSSREFRDVYEQQVPWPGDEDDDDA